MTGAHRADPAAAGVLLDPREAELRAGTPQARAPVWAIAAAALFASGQGAFYNTLELTTIQNHVSSSHIARISAYNELGGLFLVPVALALTGTVADHIGVSATLVISALSVIVLTTITLTVGSVRRLGMS